MSELTFYRLSNNISLTQIEDESVLLNLDNGSYYGLNHIGTELLNRLVAKQSLQASCVSLAAQYSMPEQTIIKDIDELLAQLLEQGLIEVESA